MQNYNGKPFHETNVIFMLNSHKKNLHVLGNALAHLSTKAFKTRFKPFDSTQPRYFHRTFMIFASSH
jgi:hypothetical protein